MSDSESTSNPVVRWFKEIVRPILQTTDSSESIDELDKLKSHVEELERSKGKLFPICLLGQAGVGKSTLINTLIAGTNIVVPSGGGTGPLTANALRVVYGERASLVVRYHSKKQVNEARFILESHLLRQAKKDAARDADTADIDPALLNTELDSDEQKKSRTEEAIGRARLLVAGGQSTHRDLTYLVDALRWVLGQESKFKSQLSDDDMARLNHVQIALQHGTAGNPRHFDSQDDPDFGKRLRAHACGFLAPLIQEMTIHWPSPLLKDSLELIDLPGIGILSDAYASVTSDYLRNKAKAVMMVVDSRGVTRENAELLKTSGFLNRLLFASNDISADPVALIVVVVKVDDVAVENWLNDKEMNGGKAEKTKAEHFGILVNSCRNDICRRLEDFLREVWDDESEGKQLVIRTILDRLQVIPVSAPQFRLLHSSDPDDERPFLQDELATNIPQLRAAVSQIARQCMAEQAKRYEETQRRFFGQLRARLEVLSAQMNEETQAEEAINQFKEMLDDFMAPLQREFDTRRGGFRNFLRKTVPAQIESKVLSASQKAQRAIEGDLVKLRDANWRTLQAAVRREGTFYGSRHINLPHDFALRYEEPVAEVWARDILVQVRRETKEFSEYQSGAVTEILDWARGQGMRKSTRLLEALVEEVKQNQQQLNAVGKEAVNELRDRVRMELIKKIEDPIRKRCKKFVEDGNNYGPGVKNRILQLFRELAEGVVQAAAEPATKLLVYNFEEVESEIVGAFREHGDPLKEAADSLIQRREKAISRENSKLLTAVEAAIAATPDSSEVAA